MMRSAIYFGLLISIGAALATFADKLTSHKTFIYVDTETTCEYLVVTRGGITPRLTADGKHMGCKQ